MAIKGWEIDLYDNATQTFTSEPVLPFPDTDPFVPAIVSTGREVITIQGTRAYLFPEVRYREEAITFRWSRQSGSSLAERISNYVRSGAGLRVWAPNGSYASGGFISCTPQMLPRFASGSVPETYHHQLWSVQAVFQPYNVHSGSG